MEKKPKKLKEIPNIWLGYLVGMYFGDGYCHHHKPSRHYISEFYLDSVRNKQILIFLEEILVKQGHNTCIIKDKRSNCLRIKVNSKNLFLYLSKYKLNYILKKEKDDFKMGFLSGLIDAEGTIKSGIIVVNTNKKLLEISKTILRDYGISTNIKKRTKSKKDKKDSYRIYISVKFKKTKHISQKIGAP